MGVCRQVSEEEQDTLRRWWRAPEYWLLVAAMFVSMLGVAWWIVVPLTVAGLSVSSLPKYIGLWQINVTIPQGTAAGSAVPIRVIINGTPSNTVTVAVR